MIVIQSTNNNEYDILFKNLRTTQNVKYMFMFLNNDNYYPLEFKYNINNVPTTYYHFNEENLTILPPIGLLLFIYGKCNLYSMNDIWLDDFLLKNIFLSINNSYSKILRISQRNNPPQYINNFMRYFNIYFPHTNQPSQYGGAEGIMTKQSPNNLTTTIPSVNRSPYLGRPTNIAYYITITLYLSPGKDLPKEELDKIKCQMRKDNINKSWADIRNLRYSPQPIS